MYYRPKYQKNFKLKNNVCFKGVLNGFWTLKSALRSIFLLPIVSKKIFFGHHSSRWREISRTLILSLLPFSQKRLDLWRFQIYGYFKLCCWRHEWRHFENWTSQINSFQLLLNAFGIIFHSTNYEDKLYLNLLKTLAIFKNDI